MTPLRQRYIDDLRLKNFSPNTIKVYVHAVAKFARHFGRSPDELNEEDVRTYLVDLIERGLSRSCCVVYRNALRHLYTVTLGRPGIDRHRAVVQHSPIVASFGQRPWNLGRRFSAKATRASRRSSLSSVSW